MTSAQTRMTAALDTTTRVRARDVRRPARREPMPDLGAVFDASPIAMAVVSAQGVIQRLNGRMERLLVGLGAGVLSAAGLNPAALAAAEAAAAVHGVALDKLLRVPPASAAELAEVLSGRLRSVSFECELRAGGDGATGDAVIARVTVSSLRPGAASPPALLTIEDLSRKRRAEARAAELESQIRHLARLSLAGELSASLAHEMGQPLAAVANYTQAALLRLSRAGGCSEEVLAHLRAAEAAAQRGGRILRNLAGFVRAGRCDRSRENLCEVVAEVREMITAAAASARVPVTVQVLDDSLPVLVDRVQVQQVLLNLVKNAAEATAGVGGPAGVGPAGVGPAVAAGETASGPVLVRVWSPEDGVAEVAVRDEGPGLPPRVAEKIFSPFFTTKPQGMGLGLAICRSIIEAHGGGLWGENNPPPAPGATFRFRLPLQTNPGDKSYDG